MEKLKSENKNGFLTIELMISLALMTLILTAIILVSFGNQNILVDSQTNSEALNIAQELLEKAQVDARKDFNLVNPYSIEKKYSEDEPGNFKYTGNAIVEQKDFFTKLVTAEVSWPNFLGIKPKVKLNSLITNFNNAVGGDTCSSVILPDSESWKNLKIDEKFSDFSSLTGITDNYPITDIDVYKNKLYTTIAKTSEKETPTFFVFNIKDNDTSNPKIQEISNGFVDNDLNFSTGLNAVTVAEDPAINPENNPNTETVYAYVAGGLATSGQLQIIQIDFKKPTNPAQIDKIELKKSLKISNVAGNQGVGNSIFYKDGYIYLGLKATGIDSVTGESNGPEFHIIDVHKVSSSQISEIGHWPESGGLNNDINAIYVRGNFAYLATTNDKKLIVLDISNASSPKEVGSFDDDVGNHGKSMYFVENNLYLGRTEGGVEFSILDESDPTTYITTSTPEKILGSESDINKSVDGLIIRGLNSSSTPQTDKPLAFLLTKEDFEVFNIADMKNIELWGNETLGSGTFGNNTYEPILDCEGNNFFVGSNDDVNNGYLSVITPS